MLFIGVLTLVSLQFLTAYSEKVPTIFVNKAGSFDVSAKNPAIKIKINDASGKLFESLTVNAVTAVHRSSKSELLSKKPFKYDSVNKVYELNVFESKPTAGFYDLKLSASSSTDKRLVGNEAADLSFKVTTEITVENTQLAVTDREQAPTPANMIKLASYSKHSSKLEADYHQKLVISFNVKDKTAIANMKIHQAFVIFTHLETSREIIFIAECDKSKLYTVDVDFLKSAKDFDYQNGKYSVKLILGDFLINNPVDWLLADIQLKFPHHEKPPKSGVEHISYEKKPEIQHMFRPAEKRPPQIVSDTFTVLTLLPLLLLFIIWLRIGVNVSNFKFTLPTIGFHVGLAGIFGLYFLFWLQLNMFQTLKYLAAIACFTFLTGNRMLKAMADRRKTKTD